MDDRRPLLIHRDDIQGTLLDINNTSGLKFKTIYVPLYAIDVLENVGTNHNTLRLILKVVDELGLAVAGYKFTTPGSGTTNPTYKSQYNPFYVYLDFYTFKNASGTSYYNSCIFGDILMYNTTSATTSNTTPTYIFTANNGYTQLLIGDSLEYYVSLYIGDLVKINTDGDGADQYYFLVLNVGSQLFVNVPIYYS